MKQLFFKSRNVVNEDNRKRIKKIERRLRRRIKYVRMKWMRKVYHRHTRIVSPTN